MFIKITFADLDWSLNPIGFCLLPWPTWVEQPQTAEATPIPCQPTYRMCLCIGYSQRHTSVKHATNGEPYNCGESTEGDLLQCLPGWQKCWLCLGGLWLNPQYGRNYWRLSLGLGNSWSSKVYSWLNTLYFAVLIIFLWFAFVWVVFGYVFIIVLLRFVKPGKTNNEMQYSVPPRGISH